MIGTLVVLFAARPYAVGAVDAVRCSRLSTRLLGTQITLLSFLRNKTGLYDTQERK